MAGTLTMEGAAENPETGWFKFLECGNGDTILIRAGDEWALVDCNLLPRTKERLEKCVRDYGIRRLRFVVVTHFDRDHVRGMAKFLREHFSSVSGTGGEKTTTWRIDQLILPVPITELEDNLSAIGSCYEMLEKYARGATHVQYCQDAQAILELALALNRQKPVVPGIMRVRDYQPGATLDGTRFGPFDVVFLAPAVKAATKFVQWFRKAYAAADRVRHLEEEKRAAAEYGQHDRSAQEYLARLENRVRSDRFWDNSRPGWNANSVVMALRDSKGDRTVLLCGDLPKREWQWAAREWRKFCRIGAENPNRVPDRPFDLVKASHHGSKTDHVRELYERFEQSGDREKEPVVIVSALDGDSKHPADNAVEDWHFFQWQVWHTRKGRMHPSGMPGGASVALAGIAVNIGREGVIPNGLLPVELESKSER